MPRLAGCRKTAETSTWPGSRGTLHRGSRLLLAIAIAFTGSFVFLETSSAKTFTRGQLRKLGFSGVYRGTVAGRVFFRQFNAPPLPLDQARVVNTGIVERIPARLSASVPGPLALAGVAGLRRKQRS